MNTELLPDETIDDLLLGGLCVIQKKKGFRFGTDAVLLADFAACAKNSRIAELGTGCGIISILAAHHYEGIFIDAVELQPAYAEMAERSVMLNGQCDKIKIHSADIKEVGRFLRPGTYDCVVFNPPYKKAGTGRKSAATDIAVARNELSATLEDFIRAAALLLKEDGRICLVHRPGRLGDITLSLSRYGFFLSRLRMVAPESGRPPSLILVEARKSPNAEAVIEPCLELYDASGRQTDELLAIYRQKQEGGMRL